MTDKSETLALRPTVIGGQRYDDDFTVIWRERVSKLKVVAAIAVCLPLVACIKDQEAKTADCQFKTLSVTGDRTWSVPERRLDEIVLMTLCMKAAGYDFSTESPQCAWHSGKNAYIDPHCYVSSNAIAYWWDRSNRIPERTP